MRNRFPTRTASLLAASLLLACGTGTPHPPARTSLVIVLVDTLSRDALAAAAKHDGLAALRDASLSFSNAYSTAPWTLPAVASLMTGLYPDRHGAIHAYTRVPVGIPRLAQALHDADYSTVAFTDGVFLERFYGFGAGFDLYDGMPGEDARLAVPSLPRTGAPHPLRGASLFDRAVAFLEAREPSGGPVFLFLHTYGVHDYFKLHPWTASLLPGDARRNPAAYLACLKGERSCSAPEWELLEILYRAEVEHMARGVTRLLEALEAADLAGNTLLLLASDHGEGFDVAHGRIHHGGRLHADQIRIPLWLSGPGVEPGVTTEPVSLVDVMPTVLDLLGVPVPTGLDGRSLAGLVRGAAGPGERPFYAMEHYHRWRDGRRTPRATVQDDPVSVAVIRGRDWYIRDPGGEELYDMSSDRRQVLNVVDRSPAAAALRSLADARGSASHAPERVEPDATLTEQLRSLGYVE